MFYYCKNNIYKAVKSLFTPTYSPRCTLPYQTYLRLQRQVTLYWSNVKCHVSSNLLKKRHGKPLCWLLYQGQGARSLCL